MNRPRGALGAGGSGAPARRRRGISAAPALALALAALSALASCAGSSAARGGPAAGVAAAAQAPAAPSPSPAREAGFLEALPPAARDFAAEFAARAARGDWSWVGGRADAAFKAAHPGGAPDDPGYLARLLRLAATGGGQVAGGEEAPLPVFKPALYTRVAFTEAELRGPVAVLVGFLEGRGAPRLAFELRLLWRLDPPAILGEAP